MGRIIGRVGMGKTTRKGERERRDWRGREAGQEREGGYRIEVLEGKGGVGKGGGKGRRGKKKWEIERGWKGGMERKR